MALSAGGFFKNFVKGAAQQYNTNVAYVEQQKIEEERAKKKEKRQFGYDKRLKEMEYDLKLDVEKAKSKNKKKYLGQYDYRDSRKGKFNIIMPEGYANLTDDKTKFKSALNAYSSEIPKLDVLKTQLTDQSYQNLLSDIVLNYAGMSTVKDGKVEGQDVEIVYNPTYYKTIMGNSDLAGVFSQQLQKNKNDLELYIKDTNPDAFLDSKAEIKENDGMVTMSIPGFYGADKRGTFKKEDIMIAQRSILRTGSTFDTITWMNNQNDFMKQQTKEHQERFGSSSTVYTGSDLIKAIAIGKNAINSRLEPSQISALTPEVGQVIRNEIKNQMPELGEAIINDPQIFHRIIKNSIPRKANPPLRQVNNQQVLANKEQFLTRVFGSDKGKMIVNSLGKSQQSGARFVRAREVITLVDSGAGTGYAAGIQAGTTGFIEQAKSLVTRITGYKGGDSQLGDVAKDLDNEMNTFERRMAEANTPIQKEQIAKDALLKYTTTLMVFDIATMAQDAGGGLTAGGTTVRLSDGDVRLSAQALQQTLNENPESIKIVAMKVAELAEKEKVIFEMIARGDVADAGAALVMMDAYRGELGTLISALQTDGGASLVGKDQSVNKGSAYKFRKTKDQEVAEEENQIANVSDQKGKAKIRKKY